jgi:hypothetical protein
MNGLSVLDCVIIIFSVMVLNSGLQDINTRLETIITLLGAK